MQERVEFICQRDEEGEYERIEVSFDSTKEDINDLFKRFGNFLIAMSYSPETVQHGADEFNVEAL